METKRVELTLADVETGEIYSTSISYQLVTSKKFDDFMKKWTESFKRGLRLDKNLQLNIVAKDWVNPVQLDIF